ncbi:MAG: DNA-binding protein [Mesorhizobium sp.]|uniref:helix-turn-helix domain-containing protein n=1 Tax=unclassified Mesorhizobium TaxID=325217 RepID=UPI000FCBB939|nr:MULTISPECIES: helix-turn-helix domain-containing protein [unclassified Mesorhizobium]MBZ9981313.1 helix-turn-helix domain-containing protein [Mesorhizobium sp. BR-1-1-8]RUZ75614.1 DNA-binding protein [Mesorhizobium sp. M7A.F.Ca.US.006.01.1.1]RWB05490.1 MAG: DNA-binding protein [Mesorhizobium sp.]RWB12539.1 MAG: DNA-binding protein [Mesorhizobium sp.]TPL33707.1 helix-turn-helix domain-containing protein [Mesorhizobium sp. B2-4-8]
MEVSPNAFTVAGFCAAFGVGRSLLYEEMRAGRIPYKKAGRKTLIRRADAEAWLDSLPEGKKEA